MKDFFTRLHFIVIKMGLIYSLWRGLIQFVSRVILFCRTTIRSHAIRGLGKVIWKIYLVTNKEKLNRNILYHKWTLNTVILFKMSVFS